MEFRKTFAVGFLVAGTAFAQVLEDQLRLRIATVPYPPLAEQSRIQGDVHLKINSGVVALIAGHPLLAKTAVESARAFGPIRGERDLDVTYHFVLADTTTSVTSMTGKRRSVLRRVVLHIFGLKADKASLQYQCQEGTPPTNDVKLASAVIEVWINGRSRCFQPETSTLAAK